MKNIVPPIGRFAPSPTGPLHLGSIVAALGSYLMAKKPGGKWLLRMEDLDTPRVVPEMADDILKTLETLGLLWDGEIVWQSRRTEAYDAALKELVGKGAVYCCGCSRAEIARISSAPHGNEGEFVYPGICRGGLAAGKEPRAWRVRVDDRPIFFDDGIMGQMVEVLTCSCGDFVVKRADGPYAYQLAVVVDDEDAGVNQVVRGADLLSSTARQIHLQRLLGSSQPSYFHLPLVTGSAGGKLSKRDNAVSVASGLDLRRDGPLLWWKGLSFLGQQVPKELQKATISDIHAWSLENFDAALIPRESAPFPL